MQKNNYYTIGQVGALWYLDAEIDPFWDAEKNNYYTKTTIDAKWYLTWYTETDPVYSASAAVNVTNTKISHWDNAYSRGNHALAWYLTWYTEIDPVWNSISGNYYTTSQIWAFWFLTWETDPIWNSISGSYYTASEIDVKLSALGWWLVYKWLWDYSTGNLPADVLTGWFYYISVAGTYNWLSLSTWDEIIARGYVNWWTTSWDWDIILAIVSESDPIYLASASANISSGMILSWDAASNWVGDNSFKALYFRNNSWSYYTKSEVNALFIGIWYSPWIASWSNYYYNSWNIGIWLNNPLFTLDVLGTARFGGISSYSCQMELWFLLVMPQYGMT